MRRLPIVFLLVLVACGGGSGTSAPPTLPPLPAAPATGCERAITRLSEGQTHIQPPARATYRTEPPTSGPHYPRWAPTGVHTEKLQAEVAVHNLEHGHVVIWINGLNATQTAELRAFAAAERGWVVVSPRPTMGKVKIAFTAWRALQRCGKLEGSITPIARAFFDSYARKAPEKIAGTPLAG